MNKSIEMRDHFDDKRSIHQVACDLVSHIKGTCDIDRPWVSLATIIVAIRTWEDDAIGMPGRDADAAFKLYLREVARVARDHFDADEVGLAQELVIKWSA